MTQAPTTNLGRIRAHEDAALRHRAAIYRAELDAHGSVHWNDDYQSYVVLGEAEVRRVLRNPQLYSSQNSRGSAAMAVEDEVRKAAINSPDMADLIARGYGQNPGVRAGSNADPPRHTTQRSLISPAFSPRRVRSFQEEIERVAEGIIEALEQAAGSGEVVDLVPCFTGPLPLQALARVLGVAPEHTDDYARWSIGLLKPVGRVSVERDELEEMVRARKEFDRYFAELIEDRLAHPRDDFMTDYAHGATSGSAPLSLDEMLAIIEQFVIAGHETTTKLLGSMLLLLSENPELIATVREDAEARDAFIDETLRLESPAQVINRLTMEDSELGGVQIPAGSSVMVVVAAASRDRRTVPHPDELDLHRPDRRGHFGFGFGIHFCVGHALARLEAQVGIRRFLQRFDFALAGGVSRESLRFLPSYAMQGPVELPAVLSHRGDAAS